LINVGNFIDFVIIPDLGYYSGIRAGFPASLNGKLLRVSISRVHLISKIRAGDLAILMGNAPTARVSNRASFDIFSPLSSCLTNSLWKTVFARAKFLERSSSSWGRTYWRKRTRNRVKKIDGLIGEPNWAREGQIYFWSCIHLKERIVFKSILILHPWREH